jgi:hypothetical protein
MPWKLFPALSRMMFPLIEVSVLSRTAVMLLTEASVTSPKATILSSPVALRSPRVTDPALAVRVTSLPEKL